MVGAVGGRSRRAWRQNKSRNRSHFPGSDKAYEYPSPLPGKADAPCGVKVVVGRYVL